MVDDGEREHTSVLTTLFVVCSSVNGCARGDGQGCGIYGSCGHIGIFAIAPSIAQYVADIHVGALIRECHGYVSDVVGLRIVLYVIHGGSIVDALIAHLFKHVVR